MDKRVFIEKLSALGVECMVLDDKLINPIEIIVFTCKKKQFFQAMQSVPQVINDEGKKRKIKIVSYKEVGISQWKDKLEENGMGLGGKVSLVCEEDSNAFFLYYAFVFVQTKHWLYYNILQVLKQRLNCSCVSDLENWLATYMRDKNYSVKVRKIVELPNSLLQQLSPVQKGILFLNQFRLKLLRRLTIKTLWVKGVLHNALTRNKYIKRLEKTAVLGNEWSVLNKKDEGASGCILIKDSYEKGDFFVKGNESPVYQGIKNEILTQKKLLQYSEDCTWFLPMIDCDSLFTWIRYEFVTWKLLSRYLEKQTFSKDELELLGEYLVTVLDNLYAMNIVHNDLRCENIMVRTKEDGTLGGFVLIDFGCSSVENSFPWKRETYWGKYLAKVVCGKMRYNESIVDDAASALLVYLNAGGNSEDLFALKIKERIGRIYFICE